MPAPFAPGGCCPSVSSVQPHSNEALSERRGILRNERQARFTSGHLKRKLPAHDFALAERTVLQCLGECHEGSERGVVLIPGSVPDAEEERVIGCWHRPQALEG